MLQENQLNNANEWRRKAYLPYPTFPTLPFYYSLDLLLHIMKDINITLVKVIPHFSLSGLFNLPPQLCTGWTETWDSPYPLCIHSSWILGQHHLILLSHSIWGSSNHQLEIVWFCIIWWNCLKQKTSR